MNDALRTNVFVRFSPETVAAACIYLAARVKRVPLPSRPHWFHVFSMEETELRLIASAVLKLYKRPKPNAELLERAVEELRTRQQEQRLKNKLLSGTTTPLGAGNFSPAASQHNSPSGPQQTGSGGTAAGAGAGAASALPSRHTPNGDAAKLNKENIAVKREDSSRSHSSTEDLAERRKLKAKNKDRSRHRSRSRSPPEKRRRHSSTPDRHRSKHKKDKSRDKHRRRSAERIRSRSRSRTPTLRTSSKPSKRERRSDPGGKGDRQGRGGGGLGGTRNRHRADKKRSSYDNGRKRR